MKTAILLCLPYLALTAVAAPPQAESSPSARPLPQGGYALDVRKHAMPIYATIDKAGKLRITHERPTRLNNPKRPTPQSPR